MNAIYVLQMS